MLGSGLVWLLAFLFSSPQLFLYKVQEIQVKNVTLETCYVLWRSKTTETLYIIYHFMFQFFAPLILLIFLYTKIFFSISKYNKLNYNDRKKKEELIILGKNANQNTGDKLENILYKRSISRNKFDALILSFIIVIAFCFCGIPFYSSLIVNIIFPQLAINSKFFEISLLSNSLLKLN